MLKLNKETATHVVARPPNTWSLPHIIPEGHDLNHEQQLEAQQCQFDLSLEEAKQAAYKEGMADAQQELTQQQDTVNALIHCLTEQREHVMNQAKTHNALLNDCVSLAVNISRKVVYRELNLQPADLAELLTPLITEHHASEQRLHVRLHAVDLQRLHIHPLWDDLSVACQFSTDPTLSEGGMLIETDSQFINMSVEHRLQTIIDQLYQNMSSVPAPLNDKVASS